MSAEEEPNFDELNDTEEASRLVKSSPPVTVTSSPPTTQRNDKSSIPPPSSSSSSSTTTTTMVGASASTHPTPVGKSSSPTTPPKTPSLKQPVQQQVVVVDSKPPPPPSNMMIGPNKTATTTTFPPFPPTNSKILQQQQPTTSPSVATTTPSSSGATTTTSSSSNSSSTGTTVAANTTSSSQSSSTHVAANTTDKKPWGKLVLANTNYTDIPKEFSLTEDVITIGRLPDNNVRIFSKQQAKFVSRHHAKIYRHADVTFEIEDLKSLNGTLVNGRKISKAFLKHGDLIIITGGTTATTNGFITLGDKSRHNFATEQEWKTVLVDQLKQAFIYRFELLDPVAIMKTLSSANLNNFNSVGSVENGSVDHVFVNSSSSSGGTSSTGGGNNSNSNSADQLKRTLETAQLDSASTSAKRVKESHASNGSEPTVLQTQGTESDTQKLKLMNDTCQTELTCCICYNWFVEPTMLQCGHNFCKKCLYDWLAKNQSCPLCRKKMSKGSYPNRQLEGILNTAVKTMLSEDDQLLREERIKAIKQKFDEDLAKLYGMIENAKVKKIKFLNIKDRWKLEEKRTFKNGAKQYFGKCREVFCELVGLTEDFVNKCNNEELVIACDNLEIPVAYIIVGQEVKTMRRVIDFDQTRQRLQDFWNAEDNLFFY
ncbi:hypothetical protein C9374_007479 [Naegleria lovaniensis]|uniref:E3 ubiquitin-protein ligase CHFR n=1 Tax=Naegleria lovaniensis TaxID=51637 RepID=A0AA88GM66_NAELO|nr:uncharacterized protein C9374_007479 [Naegleria lovaniensis]KAG2379340.1 hypothetical protein C9374_007479 [Naegleria lovaniensis]